MIEQIKGLMEQMECVGRINKKGGSVDDLPIEIKRQVYNFIMSLDLDEDDKLRAEGQHGMHQSDEVPGIGVIVYDEKIVALIKMGVYNLESESVDDEIMVAIGIPRNDIERLIKEN